jgi:hypothetical protein
MLQGVDDAFAIVMAVASGMQIEVDPTSWLRIPGILSHNPRGSRAVAGLLGARAANRPLRIDALRLAYVPQPPGSLSRHCTAVTDPGSAPQGLTIVHGNGDCVETLGINANVCLRMAGADPSVKVYLGEQARPRPPRCPRAPHPASSGASAGELSRAPRAAEPCGERGDEGGVAQGRGRARQGRHGRDAPAARPLGQGAALARPARAPAAQLLRPSARRDPGRGAQAPRTSELRPNL